MTQMFLLGVYLYRISPLQALQDHAYRRRSHELNVVLSQCVQGSYVQDGRKSMLCVESVLLRLAEESRVRQDGTVDQTAASNRHPACSWCDDFGVC